MVPRLGWNEERQARRPDRKLLPWRVWGDEALWAEKWKNQCTGSWKEMHTTAALTLFAFSHFLLHFHSPYTLNAMEFYSIQIICSLWHRAHRFTFQKTWPEMTSLWLIFLHDSYVTNPNSLIFIAKKNQVEKIDSKIHRNIPFRIKDR